jgi:hypothetical protein
VFRDGFQKDMRAHEGFAARFVCGLKFVQPIFA